MSTGTANDLIESSMHIVGAQRSAFGTAFYQNFLTHHPQLHSYFEHVDMSMQHRKLTIAIVTLVDSMGDEVALENTIRGLAEMHQTMGLSRQHFDLFKGALLQTLAEFLGDEWSNDHHCAWDGALDHFVDLIFQRYL